MIVHRRDHSGAYATQGVPVVGLEELYDMEKDPDELDNLAIKREHQTTLKPLRAALIVELRRHKAGFVDNMPQVR